MAEKRSQADELIAFRDGQPTTDEFRKELRRDRELLLKLADSRLLALALSIPRESDPNSEWPLPPDDELISYLLNRLADDQLWALEQRVKKNPRAFARLLELRKALADAARSGRPPHAWRRVELRERLGTARFRPANGHLEFAPDQLMMSRLASDTAPRTPMFIDPLSKSFSALALAAPLSYQRMPRYADLRASKHPPMPVDDELSELTHRAGQLIDAIRRITRILEDTLPEASQTTIAKTIRPLEDAARDLEIRIEHLRLTTRPEPFREPRFEALAERALPKTRAFQDEVQWHPTLRLQTSHALVSLSGTTGHPMELQVLLQNPEASPVANALATLVGPRQTFEGAETNAEGRCSFPLEQGASVLLIDAGKPLAEIRLRSSRS